MIFDRTSREVVGVDKQSTPIMSLYGRVALDETHNMRGMVMLVVVDMLVVYAAVLKCNAYDRTS